MDKYSVSVIGGHNYEIESDDISYQSNSIIMYKMGKLEGVFPIKKTSFIRIYEEDEENNDPHIKYKNV